MTTASVPRIEAIPFDMPIGRNGAATSAYDESMRVALAEVERIRKALESHAGKVIKDRHHGRDLHWGHVGDLNKTVADLREVATWGEHGD